MPKPRRSSGAPWITAGVAAVVLAALLVVFYAVLLPDRANNVVGDLTSTEKAAVTAATTESVNLLSYRRSAFEADYQRALAGTTGALKSDVTGRKAVTLKTLTAGKFDLTARATHSGLVGPSSSNKTNGYVVLVTVNGYKSTEPVVPNVQNLKVTVVQVKGKWLANDVTLVGVS